MDQELKNRWVAALRSGEYEQAISTLRDADDRMCCLGVLCDVIDSTRWTKMKDGRWRWATHSHSYIDSFDLDTNEWGLNQAVYWNYNDGDGNDRLTFSEIADRIEMDPYL